MKDKPKEQPVPQPPKPKRKGTVLDQLKIRRAEQAALKKLQFGSVPPTGPKPVSPPKTLTPAELKVTPPVVAQVPPPPLPPMPILDEEGSVLEIAVAKMLRNRTDMPSSKDTGMELIQSISLQIQTGQPLKILEALTEKFLGEITAKTHIWQTALAYHDIFERGALYAQSRWYLEKSLYEDLVKNILTPAEKLALLQMCVRETDKIKEGAARFQGSLESSGKGSAGDIAVSTERADRTLEKVDDPTVKHLAGTSSTGRELARRLLDTAGKNAEKIVADALAKPTPA